MVIVGDVAWPYPELRHQGFDDVSTFVFNCEGYVVEADSSALRGVYNNLHALASLPGTQRIGVIANNHIMDRPQGASLSKQSTSGIGIPLVGADRDVNLASESYRFSDGGTDVSLICAGWAVIGCSPAGHSKEGVSPMREAALVSKVKEEKDLGRSVVLYLHWGYELEAYPHPAHRELAMRLIDEGADIIIGAHAHRIQGHEMYAGKHIFYGLGNAVFAQGHYFSKRLTFPDVCRTGLAVRWDAVTNEAKVANVDISDGVATCHDWLNVSGNEELQKLSGFSDLSSLEYGKYFRVNRVKRKFLPVFDSPDSTVDSRLKAWFVHLRGRLIGLAFKLGVLGY